MKNVRVKVWKNCTGNYYSIRLCEGKKQLMRIMPINNGSACWQRKDAAIRNAKAMAKRIGIKYDPEIIKQHGC